MTTPSLKLLSLGVESANLLPWVLEAIELLPDKSLQSLPTSILEVDRAVSRVEEVHDKKLDLRLTFSTEGFELTLGKSTENPAAVVTAAILVLDSEGRDQVLKKVFETNRKRKGNGSSTGEVAPAATSVPEENENGSSHRGGRSKIQAEPQAA